VELEAEWRTGAWSVRGSAMALRARRDGAADASLNGLRPVNVPATSLKLQGVYNVRAVPGLALLGFVIHEGERMVLANNQIATPGWTRLDLGARWTHKSAGRTLVWRAGLDNVTNTRAWKEAPLQYGHVYLYPLAPRTLRLSLTATL
jgi:iron complex outermembrane receptor protein